MGAEILARNSAAGKHYQKCGLNKWLAAGGKSWLTCCRAENESPRRRHSILPSVDRAAAKAGPSVSP